jgi:hypothetical protein
MRLLFLGDIVGKPGLTAITRYVPKLRENLKLDYVIANAENAADGSGLTVRQYKKLTEPDMVDILTLGDHAYKKNELLEVLDQSDRLVRPANFPLSAPGKSWAVAHRPHLPPIAVFTVLGRVFMRPVDCPFAACERVLCELPTEVVARLVDVHAEATSDKQLLAHFLDGRVSAVVGTHTHVPTSDARISKKGTAAITDVGMCGPYNSIIGRSSEQVLETTLSYVPKHYHVATDDVRLCGAIAEIDAASGRTLRFERFELAIENEARPETSR